METRPNILIIGGKSPFGQQFHSLFEKHGAHVTSIGRAEKDSQQKLISESDIVIVSVPIHATTSVLQEVIPHAQQDSLLADFTSLKKFPTDLMKKSNSGALGMHPMWGPLIEDIRGRNIIFCPIQENKYCNYLRDVFKKEGVNVVEMTPEEHDKKMAYVQALTHTTSIGFLKTTTDTLNVDNLLQVSTPIFKNQTLLGGRILAGDPQLYANIEEYNPYFDTVLKTHIRNLKTHRKILKKKKLAAYFTQLASKLEDFVAQAKEESRKVL